MTKIINFIIGSPSHVFREKHFDSCVVEYPENRTDPINMFNDIEGRILNNDIVTIYSYSLLLMLFLRKENDKQANTFLHIYQAVDGVMCEIPDEDNMLLQIFNRINSN